mgnify:CR=1 FL=1
MPVLRYYVGDVRDRLGGDAVVAGDHDHLDARFRCLPAGVSSLRSQRISERDQLSIDYGQTGRVKQVGPPSAFGNAGS